MPQPSPPVVTVALPAIGSSRVEPLLAFLGARALPGLESWADGTFRRNLPRGWLELSLPPDGTDTLQLRYQLATVAAAPAGPVAPVGGDEVGSEAEALVALVRRVADLDRDLDPVADVLAADEALAPRLVAVGLSRLPGTFDPFELALRAVVGQQVSVAAARTLLGRLVDLVEPAGPDGERRAFPPADAVARTDLSALGMPASRRATITGLARAVVDGRVDLGGGGGPDPERLRAQLVALPGIGPWTAGYIAMRVVPDGDGWPTGDLVLRQSLGLPAAELERRAATWRPWRAYAALLLWRTAPPPTPRRPRP